MESRLNFGRLYVHTIHQHAGGPFFCATRLGEKDPYKHHGVKLLWQQFSKEGIPLKLQANFIACGWLGTLKDAGAEERIWPTQFGLRSGCGCADAIFK